MVFVPAPMDSLEPLVKQRPVWDTILPKEHPVVVPGDLVWTTQQMGTTTLRSHVLVKTDGQTPLARLPFVLQIVREKASACPLLPLCVRVTKDGLEPTVLNRLWHHKNQLPRRVVQGILRN